MQSKGPDLELTHNQYDQQEGVNPDREHQDNMETLPERKHLNHLHIQIPCNRLDRCNPVLSSCKIKWEIILEDIV